MIQLRKVVKRYKRRTGILRWEDLTVLDHIDAVFRDGLVSGILGKSGSGKTTLANIITGYDTPDSGEVIYYLDEASGLKKGVRSDSFIYVRGIFQDPYSSLNPLQTVGWHVEHTYRRVYGFYNSKELRALLDRFLLPASRFYDRTVETLSGGERQRLSLAIALSIKPRVLVMDEPFSMQDSLTAMYLLGLVREAAREATVIYIDQNLNRMGYVCDFVYELAGGRFVRAGQVSEFFESRPGFHEDLISSMISLGERIN